MNNINSKYPPAFVTYMSYSGLGIVRSLGRQGIPVYALDPNANQIGLDSHYCKGLVCPSIEESEKEHIDFLINLSQSLGQKPVLFPTGDNTVYCYARNENLLKKYFLFSGPDRHVIAKVATKDALYKSAVKFKLPVPQTYIPSSIDEVHKICSKISYPALIKPIKSNAWHQEAIKEILSGDQQKVLIANKADELLDNYKKIAKYDPNIIMSEVIPGDDSNLYYFASYISKNYEVLAKFSGRKKRIYPIHFGSASFVESIYDEELENCSINFLKNIEYTGLSGIEFKRDSRDGQYKLIEVNARFGLWDVLASKCGIDIAYIAYCDIIGEQQIKKYQYKTGIKWVSIYRDTKAFFDYRKEGSLTIMRWIRTLYGKKLWAVFAWDDIRPFISSITKYLFDKINHVISITILRRLNV
jgi:predicted ATP-grasp superfamily ATP-dependent carboligase